MLLCPVDLAPCGRAQCSSGHCAQVDEPRMQVCIECGAIESQGRTFGLCVACWTTTLAPSVAAVAAKE